MDLRTAVCLAVLTWPATDGSLPITNLFPEHNNLTILILTPTLSNMFKTLKTCITKIPACISLSAWLRIFGPNTNNNFFESLSLCRSCFLQNSPIPLQVDSGSIFGGINRIDWSTVWWREVRSHVDIIATRRQATAAWSTFVTTQWNGGHGVLGAFLTVTYWGE